ncbi:alpha/beta fold hydrolase [Labedaea rhizosphaerae]|uniref:Lipase n=1 Tax=Labedaea rhizosphaerae TaxID=598644 RepID=A0A4R6S2V6_LABRH|nr:alpha/beta fold hydrolase [Labedaea rhizosphaerae]TDP93901.1 lipase [Labedaea rhizosphaerae]
MADQLHVHTFGPVDAPPLLALHGITGHGARFRRLAETQLAEFRVIAPDLRGHGRSPKTPPWTLEQHAADLLAVLDAHEVDSAPVVGHSFGGPVALQLAQLAQQRVRRLVLLDPAVGMPPERLLDVARGAYQHFSSREELAAYQRDAWPFADESLIAEELAENTSGTAYRYEPASIATACSEMCRTPPLPSPSLHTLVVEARREDYVSPEFVKACRFALGSSFRHAGLDSGHMLYFERPDETGELIRSFLAE